MNSSKVRELVAEVPHSRHNASAEPCLRCRLEAALASEPLSRPVTGEMLIAIEAAHVGAHHSNPLLKARMQADELNKMLAAQPLATLGPGTRQLCQCPFPPEPHPPGVHLVGTRKPTAAEEAYGNTLEPLAQEALAKPNEPQAKMKEWDARAWLQTRYPNLPISEQEVACARAVYAAGQAASGAQLCTVEQLATIIRFVDGEHKLGAGELAERILGVLTLAAPAGPAQGLSEEQVREALGKRFWVEGSDGDYYWPGDDAVRSLTEKLNALLHSEAREG